MSELDNTAPPRGATDTRALRQVYGRFPTGAMRAARGGFPVDVVDLAEVNLSLFDEPNHPMTGTYVHKHAKAWSDRVARANAWVLVTPEYDNGYLAVLKNALDHLSRGRAHKAVVPVLRRCLSRSARRPAGQAGRHHAAHGPGHDAVSISFVAQRPDESRTFQGDEITDSSAKKMLDELLLVGTPLISLQAAPNPPH